MKPRLTPLEVPESGRYFTIDLAARRTARLAEIDGELVEARASREAVRADSVADEHTARLEAEIAQLDSTIEALEGNRTQVEARKPREVHHFRLPTPARMRYLLGLRDARPGPGAIHELRAAALGLTWYHRSRELTTAWPADPTAAALVDFAEAVQIELLDAGYTEVEITILGDRCLAAILARKVDGAEVKRIADFS